MNPYFYYILEKLRYHTFMEIKKLRDEKKWKKQKKQKVVIMI